MEEEGNGGKGEARPPYIWPSTAPAMSVKILSSVETFCTANPQQIAVLEGYGISAQPCIPPGCRDRK